MGAVLAWIALVNELLVKQMQQLEVADKNVLELKIPDAILIRVVLEVC